MKQLARYCVPLFDGAGVDGAGVIGCSDDAPEPVVLGGVAVRVAVLAVVGGKEPLFALLLLVFRPAKIMNPISSSTATPATQFHAPPTFSSRRITGSLKSGSVKRGSVMASSLVRDALCRLVGRKPASCHSGSEEPVRRNQQVQDRRKIC